MNLIYKKIFIIMNLYVPKFDKCRLILYSNICTGTIMNDNKIIHLVYLRGLFLQIKETEKFEGTLEKKYFTTFYWRECCI